MTANHAVSVRSV